MKVFTDLHHGDLYYSLHRLFVERFGWELYRPIGVEWADEGYWQVAKPYGNARDTINQFLEISSGGWDPLTRLNGENYLENGIYHVWDGGHDYYQKAVTLEQFKQMRFDIVISTIFDHDTTFADLIKKFQPHAKHVSQMGNLNQVSEVPNVMSSVPYTPKEGQNYVFYHQEVDPKLFYPTPVPTSDPKKIYSFVGAMDPHLYLTFQERMPDIIWKAHGVGCPDGPVGGGKAIAPMMREANLGWHIKPGDGFGHTVMDWYASGRAVATKFKDIRAYNHFDATSLFEDGVTAINLDGKTVQENIKTIRHFLEPENNARLCEQAGKRFREIVNYDEEERALREFFGRLL